jgi:hypothetical protein
VFCVVSGLLRAVAPICKNIFVSDLLLQVRSRSSLVALTTEADRRYRHLPCHRNHQKARRARL